MAIQNTTLQESDLRTLARIALAALTRKHQGTLSVQIEPLLEAWVEALPYLARELGESFGGTTADKITRRAVGMLLRPTTAYTAVDDEVQALLMQNDEVNNLLAAGDWHEAAWRIREAALAAYHAALAEGPL